MTGAEEPGGLAIIAGTDAPAEAQSWGLVLSAIALPHRVVDRAEEPLPYVHDADEWTERFCLVVSAEDAGRVRAILDAQGEEERAKRKDEQAITSEARARTRPGMAAAASLFLCALLVIVFLRTPGF